MARTRAQSTRVDGTLLTPKSTSLNALAPSQAHPEPDELEMLGAGPAMTRLRLQVQRIAPHFRTVLLSGEPGTGKKLVAQVLHRLSQGAKGPFVLLRPSETVAEGSRGTDKGATSAEQVESMVKKAHGGTVFFDGIGEMPLEGQIQLLRILKGKESELSAAPKMNLRIIASTGEDLKALAFAGRFQHELHQRLAMVEIALPPLRERREDIPELAMWLLRRLSLQSGRRIEAVAAHAMQRLEEHSWPGNVPALEAALLHAVLRCDGSVLEANHLPALTESVVVPPVAEMPRLQDVVEQHVLRVLKSCAGNKLRAAEVLGISRSTLYRMLSAEEGADQDRSTKAERYT